MKLVNETPFETALARIDLGDRGLVASVIVKSTFDLDASGGLHPARTPVRLIPQFMETPYGVFHSEYFFKKQGIDACVLGTVRRPEPVRQTRLKLSIGTRSWELRVYGDRRWRRSGDAADLQLRPSPAEPFTEMPLGYSRAFGGAPLVGYMPCPYPANPHGRGYYLRAEDACDQLLPNIEHADDSPADVWSAESSPRVAGWGPYPNFWGLRAETSLRMNEDETALAGASATLFNHAHPDLVLDALPKGARLRLEGMSPDVIECVLPAPPARIDVTVGAERFEVAAPIDGLFLWCDDYKLVVTQRGRFTYEVRAEELRTVRVRCTEALGGVS